MAAQPESLMGEELAGEGTSADMALQEGSVGAAEDFGMTGAEQDAAPAESMTSQTPEMTEPETEPMPAEPATPPAAPAPSVAAPGLVDRLLANPLWLGAGAVVLGLLAFFGLRRKRGVETEFQESILQAAQSKAGEAADSSEIVASAATSTSSQSSLLSEFAVSDMGSMKSDGEADPLAEADVYLAYGRYQQAEDLITDALESNPDNEDLNLKLLEVFTATRNQAAFDDHAQVVMQRFGNDSAVWEKASEMGRELSPDNALYQAGGATPSAETGGHSAEAGMDTPDDEPVFKSGGEEQDVSSAAPVQGDSESAPSKEEGLDFEIDLSSFEEEQDSDARADEAGSVDFTPPEAGKETRKESAEPSLDIDMDSIEPDALADDTSLDFNLDGLDMDMGDETDGGGEGELADLDEISTKLDLARAYIDMGDPDGARSILDEVIDEGSDDQKDEARGIMEKITS
jgi:pilus assembly protein FimV